MTTPDATTAANASTAGAASTGSDLDSLIKEFDEGTNTNGNAAIAKVLKSIQPLVENSAAEQKARIDQKVKEQISANTSLIRKEAGIPDVIPDYVIEGILHKQANDDPEAAAAWQEVALHPEKLGPHVKKEAEKCKEWASKIPAQDTTRTDVERATASVRNVSTSPNAAVKHDPRVLMDMPEREFQKLLEGA